MTTWFEPLEHHAPKSDAGQTRQLEAQERPGRGRIHRIALQTSNSIRDIIWLINPAFDTMQDLVLRTKDFAGTALARRRIPAPLPDLIRRKEAAAGFPAEPVLPIQGSPDQHRAARAGPVAEAQIKEARWPVAGGYSRQWRRVRPCGGDQRERAPEPARPRPQDGGGVGNSQPARSRARPSR